MIDWANLDMDGLYRVTKQIERDCQEGVRWERRKLQWILDEKRAKEFALDEGNDADHLP